METPKTNEAEIPKQLDRYELQNRIGAGGMGLIYKGFDTRLKRPVAIKIISSQSKDSEMQKNLLERFFNEARAAGGLSHPNLVQIYDYGEAEKMAYIVMEFIEGETLESLLRSRGKMSLEELLRVAKDVASGLAFAHKKGIVHRDIKPSNLIIESQTGICKILDFGIAKFVNSEEEMKLTSTGMVLGSTHYLSPEHIIGKNLDGRSDIFCLGTSLYEASTGVLPFRGSNSSSILYKIVHFDPQPIAEVRPELNSDFSELVMKCLKKSAADRFQKCEDVEKEIVSIQNSLISNRKTTGGTKTATIKTYCVRDSQLFAVLQTQKKIPADIIAKLKGQPIAETILREELLPEDELAKVVADCLDVSFIPRSRLKSLRITDEAFAILPRETIEKYHILPFFKDSEKNSLSLVVDGLHDFQRDEKILEALTKYQLQVYVAGSPSLKKAIAARLRLHESGQNTNAHRTTGIRSIEKISNKRVLLVDNQVNHHEALLSLFKRSENSLVISSDLTEASLKVKRESFDHIWANQDLIGDELAFELMVVKQNPGCEVRFYEQLGEELFEQSVNYRKFREFYNRMVTEHLATGPTMQKEKAINFASFAAKVAKPITQNTRVLDEVYFSALFWKFEQLTGARGKTVKQFDGIYRIRHIFDCITERYDGRGVLGLKESQIPLASRLLAVLFLVDSLHPDISLPWGAQDVVNLKTKLSQFSAKQLDPTLVAEVLSIIVPVSSEAKMKVAIVDSDRNFANQLAAQMKEFADPTLYEDGAAALSGIKSHRPDLIVSEVLVAKLDGFSLCARLKADAVLQGIPLVFVSESSEAEHTTKALQLGAEDFILKTSDPHFILAKLEKYKKKLA